VRVKFTNDIYSKPSISGVTNILIDGCCINICFDNIDNCLWADEAYRYTFDNYLNASNTIKENNIGDMVYTPQGQGIIIPIGENVNREDYTGEQQTLSKSLGDDGKVYELIKREVTDDTERSELIERRRSGKERDLRREIKREGRNLQKTLKLLSRGKESFGEHQA